MSNETPTDALRLVPIEPTSDMIEAFYHAEGPAGPDRIVSWSIATAMARGNVLRHLDDIFANAYRAMLAAAPASPLPEGGGTSHAAGGLDVLSRIRSRLNEQIERAEADLNSTVTIRLNDAKAIRNLLAPAAPTGDA